MRMGLAAIAVVAAALIYGGCGGGGGGGSTLDVSGEISDDIPAGEINPYEEPPEDFCKGRIRREQFAAYDWQCEEVLGLGKCVVINVNPYPEESTFYCSLCGLKGDQMVCYMIQQD